MTWIVLNIIFLFQRFLFWNFRENIRMEYANFKNENIEKKYLNNMQKSRFLKVKNSLLELKKAFIELKDRIKW